MALLQALVDRTGEIVGVSILPPDARPVRHTKARVATLEIPDSAGKIPLLELHRRLSYDRASGQLLLADRP
jgi:hypothetical protein